MYQGDLRPNYPAYSNRSGQAWNGRYGNFQRNDFRRGIGQRGVGQQGTRVGQHNFQRGGHFEGRR